MNKLWIRLTLAFALVIVVGIVMVTVIVNQQTSTEFLHFIVRSQLINPALITFLVEYYSQAGNWEGVETVFEKIDRHASPTGPGQGLMQHNASTLILSDSAV